MTIQEIEQNYSKEVYEACKLLRAGKRKLTLQEKGAIGAYSNINNSIKMAGPLIESGGTVYDAVLTDGIDRNMGEGFISVICMLQEGKYEEKKIQYNQAYINYYPGNIVDIAGNNNGISIYENKYLNSKNPISQVYIKKILKAQMSNKLYFLWQALAWFLDIILMGYLCDKIPDPGLLRFFVLFLSTVLYISVLMILKTYYIKKYTKKIYDETFINRGWLLCFINIYIMIRVGFF